MKIWHTSNKKIAIDSQKKVMRCIKCPCDCEPKVIVNWTSNGSGINGRYKCFDLTPYQGDDIGTPESKWRLIETGACLRYGLGDIDSNGKLMGLQNQFCSNFSYDGHMELQQGCIQKDDTIKWPGRCG